MFSEEEFATNGHPSGYKPAILCLHGGGTNKGIFGIQMIRIQQVLDSQFEFVYLDGPLVGEAGPGVLPFFEGFEPFLRWSVKGVEEKPAVTDALLREAMEERRRMDGRGFVGVVGFSQGAKTAAGLLLEQQLRRKEEGVDGKLEAQGLGFGVMLNGPGPPLTANLTDEEKMERIKTPALVVAGRDDPWREGTIEMFEDHFDKESTEFMEFAIGHRLPILEKDTKKVTDRILKMYWSSEGQMQQGLSA